MLRLMSAKPAMTTSHFSGMIRITTCAVITFFSLAQFALSTQVRVKADDVVQGQSATISAPSRIGGAGLDGDERDADTNPVVAYDPSSGRALTVWLSPRNASSASSGFDVFGAFLTMTGKPLGSEFRISDANTAARNSKPAVITGVGGFVVAWGARTGVCRVLAQRVSDTTNRVDQTVASGSAHKHTPALTYDPAAQRFLAVFVEGDDYLPPTLFQAQTSDCGNNSASTSRIKSVQFHFNGDTLVTDAQQDISDVAGGAFRPSIAFSPALNRYLIGWEDRRNAAGQAYRFDVFARLLTNVLTPAGADMFLSSAGGITYTNDNTSTPWTPRPTVAAGATNFLASWFERDASSGSTVWTVKTRLIPANGTLNPAFSAAQMTFASQHAANPPTGFLSAAYSNYAQEYVVAMTSHLESIFGYLSSVRGQRVTPDGVLLALNGSAMSQPAVGSAMDYTNDDQIGAGAAAVPVAGRGATGILVVYARHAPNRPSQDFDIWSAVYQLPAANIRDVFLPSVFKR